MWMDAEIDGRTDRRTEGLVDDGRTDGRTDGQAVRHAHKDTYMPIIRSLVVYVVHLNTF